ncbi:MAG: indolepyruvate oxidoreductase subunit beta [Candidatus Thorarchaeota archaeon]
MDEFNIMFTGVGGTGVLTAARILATAALIEGKNVRMGEIHGMAQRGGAVTCTIRIGSTVHGPIIPIGKADLLLSAEPVEALRQANQINENGTIIVGEYRITPTAVLLGRADYPNNEEILQDLQKFAKVISFDAVKLAQEAGSIMTLNTVLIGAAVGLDLLPIKDQSIITAIKENLPKKYHNMNFSAFELGRNISKKTLASQR